MTATPERTAGAAAPADSSDLGEESVRARYTRVLARARTAGYPPGEFVGQESFMRAGEILDLARAAGVDAGTSVLDLCCGVAGPGRHVTATLGCTYLGVDADPGAVALARRLAGDLPCRFEVGRVPDLPSGPFDVVMLLETILAFPDKGSLLAAVAVALPVGGRFAFTVEEGGPLTDDERAAMPDADTVHLVTEPVLLDLLRDNGFRVTWSEDHSAAHAETAAALLDAYAADRTAIAAAVGPDVVDGLVGSHRLWADWMARGRVRKLALVAERVR